MEEGVFNLVRGEGCLPFEELVTAMRKPLNKRKRDEAYRLSVMRPYKFTDTKLMVVSVQIKTAEYMSMYYTQNTQFHDMYLYKTH